MSFKDLPAEARPREKLIARGAGALADAELLALLLRTGIAGKNVLQLAQELLDTLRRPRGPAARRRSTTSSASRAWAAPPSAPNWRRCSNSRAARMAERLKERAVFDSPEAVKQYLQLHLARAAARSVRRALPRRAAPADRAWKSCSAARSRRPASTRAKWSTRALHHHAAAVVLAHNHPSGCVEPSRADEALTQTLKAALALVDVRVLDHVIVAPGPRAVDGRERPALRRQLPDVSE